MTASVWPPTYRFCSCDWGGSPPELLPDSPHVRQVAVRQVLQVVRVHGEGQAVLHGQQVYQLGLCRIQHGVQ